MSKSPAVQKVEGLREAIAELFAKWVNVALVGLDLPAAIEPHCLAAEQFVDDLSALLARADAILGVEGGSSRASPSAHPADAAATEAGQRSEGGE